MDWWTGLVDWTGGLNWWTQVYPFLKQICLLLCLSRVIRPLLTQRKQCGQVKHVNCVQIQHHLTVATLANFGNVLKIYSPSIIMVKLLSLNIVNLLLPISYTLYSIYSMKVTTHLLQLSNGHPTQW